MLVIAQALQVGLFAIFETPLQASCGVAEELQRIESRAQSGELALILDGGGIGATSFQRLTHTRRCFSFAVRSDFVNLPFCFPCREHRVAMGTKQLPQLLIRTTWRRADSAPLVLQRLHAFNSRT